MATSAPSHDHRPDLTPRQEQVLRCIQQSVETRGYPPSVREIGAAVGMTSPSTVHAHLTNLVELGYLRRDPTKPRAIELRFDPASGATADRAPVRHVPLLGDVAAGTGVLAAEHVEELLPLPAQFTGEGELFMLRVRGSSMIDAGILDGDHVVVRRQPDAEDGDVVVAGIPGEEATVKTLRRDGDEVVLVPSNPALEPMRFAPSEVSVFGKVVTVVRAL
ncbi:MAG: transcriptional repressor LexA [Microthrixaceae bacterium]